MLAGAVVSVLAGHRGAGAGGRDREPGRAARAPGLGFAGAAGVVDGCWPRCCYGAQTGARNLARAGVVRWRQLSALSLYAFPASGCCSTLPRPCWRSRCCSSRPSCARSKRRPGARFPTRSACAVAMRCSRASCNRPRTASSASTKPASSRPRIRPPRACSAARPTNCVDEPIAKFITLLAGDGAGARLGALHGVIRECDARTSRRSVSGGDLREPRATQLPNGCTPPSCATSANAALSSAGCNTRPRTIR